MKLHLLYLTQKILRVKSIKLFRNFSEESKFLIRVTNAFWCSCLLLACNPTYNESNHDRLSSHDMSTKHIDTYQASEELLAWLEQRVELLVKHKANCQNMALALVQDQKNYAQKLKHWRNLEAGKALAQRGVKNIEFSRKLNQVILKGDLAHSYCAYQSDFRELLERLNSASSFLNSDKL